jgi:flagellar motor switch protein FliG
VISRFFGEIGGNRPEQGVAITKLVYLSTKHHIAANAHFRQICYDESMSTENGKSEDNACLETTKLQNRFLMHVLTKQNELHLAGVEEALQNLAKEDRLSPAESIIAILGATDQSLEGEALAYLDTLDQPLTQRIRERMLNIEHIEYLDDRAVQKVLRETEMHPLALALKGTSSTLQEKVLKNMSQRAAEMLKEEMAYMGPVRLSDVEDAQKQMVAAMRMLRDKGEIRIARSSDELID